MKFSIVGKALEFNLILTCHLKLSEKQRVNKSEMTVYSFPKGYLPSYMKRAFFGDSGAFFTYRSFPSGLRMERPTIGQISQLRSSLVVQRHDLQLLFLFAGQYSHGK